MRRSGTSTGCTVGYGEEGIGGSAFPGEMGARSVHGSQGSPGFFCSQERSSTDSSSTRSEDWRGCRGSLETADRHPPLLEGVPGGGRPSPAGRIQALRGQILLRPRQASYRTSRSGPTVPGVFWGRSEVEVFEGSCSGPGGEARGGGSVPFRRSVGKAISVRAGPGKNWAGGQAPVSTPFCRRHHSLGGGKRVPATSWLAKSSAVRFTLQYASILPPVS